MLKMLAPIAAVAALGWAGSATASTIFLGPVSGTEGDAITDSAGGFFMGGGTKFFYRLKDATITDLTITGATPGFGIKIYGFKSVPIGYADGNGAFTLASPISLSYQHHNNYGRLTLYGPYFLENITLEGTAYGPIPEPSTWAIMIMGFGIAGSALRGQGRKAASV